MTTLMRKNLNQEWLPLFFNDFYNDAWKAGTSTKAPAINIIEAEQSYKIKVAAAGMTKDDFTVHLNDDNDLVITMEKKNENDNENKDVRFLRREYAYSNYRQTMVLPDYINREKIEAKVEHGILTVYLPKLSENDIQKKQRFIAVG